jgi:hypothetical protein
MTDIEKLFGGSEESRAFYEKYLKPKKLTLPNVYFSKGLPFTPDRNEIIYIESSYYKEVNEQLSINFDFWLQDLGDCEEDKASYRLTFFPETYKHFNALDAVRYYLPNLSSHARPIDVSKLTYNKILSCLLPGSPEIKCGLIKYIGEEDDKYVFSYYEFKETKFNNSFHALYTYFRGIDYQYYEEAVASCEEEHDVPRNETADYGFSRGEADKITREIQERINRLRVLGVSQLVIRELFHADQKLSSMVITKDYRILLPDYNNMEIELSPLPKALFILFLKHPDGIRFKELSQYRDELERIYLTISNREDIGDMAKSIADMTDPTKNSINEKCSRIREAFVSKFDESLASKYFVTGKRGEPKVIALDRNLVKFE